MTLFVLFALFIALAVAGLIVWPVAKHPTLPGGHKRLLASILLFVLLAGGSALYLWLGVPQLANL